MLEHLLLGPWIICNNKVNIRQLLQVPRPIKLVIGTIPLPLVMFLQVTRGNIGDDDKFMNNDIDDTSQSHNLKILTYMIFCHLI